MCDRHDFTALLDDGDPDAIERVLPLVYPELQAMARRHLSRERADHTLDTGALVHEAYLKLAGQTRATWKSRAHFLAVAAVAMRRILITYAHARNAEKRGGGAPRVTLDEARVGKEARTDELLALDEALGHLAAVSPRAARVVELWFFGGLTQAEIGEALSISEPTVRRDWRVARAYLTSALRESPLP